MNERLSVAPMLDCTTRHWRYLMRSSITRKSVLYTEMVVDSTIIFQQRNLSAFLRHDFHLDQGEGGTVVQLGGFDPEDMASAAELVNSYKGARYTEMNINCGCPSAKVVGKCFGAKLMLDPPLVRQMASQMIRRVGHSSPVTVKCRIGADERDQYEHLCEFIDEVSSAGVTKFIVHARKCHLNGLSTKQNRNIPPLQYEVVHRLAAQYPHLQIVLNGGLNTLEQVDAHLGLGTGTVGRGDSVQEWVCGTERAGENGRIHGCMVGRAVYTNPFLFSHADSRYFGASSDLCLTRRQVLQRYYDYCDQVLQEQDQGSSGLCDSNDDHQAKTDVMGGAEREQCMYSKSSDEGEGGEGGSVKIGKMLDAVKHVFHACPGAGKFRQRLHGLYSERARRRQRLNQDRGVGRVDSSFVLGVEQEGEGGAGGGGNGWDLNPVHIIQQALAETINPQYLDLIPDDAPNCG